MTNDEQKIVDDVKALTKIISVAIMGTQARPETAMAALTIAMGHVLAATVNDENMIEVALASNGPMVRSVRMAAQEARRQIKAKGEHS